MKMPTTLSQRDFSLDALRGLGCILMVFSHVWWSHWQSSSTLQLFLLIGDFAPMLFFLAVGATATIQATRVPLKIFLPTYLLLGGLGLSYNAAIRPNLWWDWQQSLVCDILQTIALGSIVIFFIAKFLKPQPWVYGVLANGVYLLFLGLNARSLTVPFPLSPWLLSSTGQYNPFPLLPWLSVFFLGAFAYPLRKSAQWWSLVYGGILFSQGAMFLFPGFWTKVPMGEGYFFLGCCSSLAALSFLRHSSRGWDASHPLVYLGQRSLLFLFVLLLVGKSMKLLSVLSGIVPPAHGASGFLVWSVAGLLSFWGVGVFERGNRYYFESVFQDARVWSILLLAILLLPLVASEVPLFVQLAEGLLGIAFASNYRQLTRLIRERWRSKEKGASEERRTAIQHFASMSDGEIGGRRKDL